MKAVVCATYGSPRIEEIEKPTPLDDEVLVRVRASSVNPADWHTMTGTPYIARLAVGLRRPKEERLGTDFAGTVEAVGKDVTQLRPGDDVFGARTGAFAEYVCVREDRAVVPKPANVTFEQAAAVPVAALTALQGLRDMGRIRAGHRVLINGASGGVGTFAVQIAKSFDAEVTAVCSTRNVETARSLGADHVVDYTQEDFTRTDRRYDVLFDIAGNRSWSETRRVLEPNGRQVLVGGPKTNPLLGPLGRVLLISLASRAGSRRAVFFIAKFNKPDMVALQELLASGKVTPAVDRRYELEQIADAFAHLAEGHAQGKIVLTV